MNQERRNEEFSITQSLTPSRCATKEKVVPAPATSTTIPEALLQECKVLPKLEDGKSITVVRWSAKVVAQYNDCKFQHSALIKAVADKEIVIKK